VQEFNLVGIRCELLQGSRPVADKKMSMPRNQSRADQKAVEISTRIFSEDFKVTPSMRRKVDDLAVWLAAGDKAKVKGATRAVIDLLCAAAPVPAARLSLQDRVRTKSKGEPAWF